MCSACPWKQPDPAVFPDPVRDPEYRAGSAADRGLRAGSSRGSLCDGGGPGRIRAALPALYCEEGSASASGEGGLETQVLLAENAAGCRISHGAAVFHYGSRDHDGTDFIEYAGFHRGSGIYGGKQDRAGGDPGLCGSGNDDGDLLRAEHRRRQGAPDPQGIPGGDADLRSVFRGGRGMDPDRRKVYDLSVPVGKCDRGAGAGGNLSEMCRDLFHSAGGGQYLPERNPGHGIWPAAHDGRDRRACRKRDHRLDRFRAEELRGSLLRGTGSLGERGPAADRDVLVYHEA